MGQIVDLQFMCSEWQNDKKSEICQLGPSYVWQISFLKESVCVSLSGLICAINSFVFSAFMWKLQVGQEINFAIYYSVWNYPWELLTTFFGRMAVDKENHNIWNQISINTNSEWYPYCHFRWFWIGRIKRNCHWMYVHIFFLFFYISTHLFEETNKRKQIKNSNNKEKRHNITRMCGTYFTYMARSCVFSLVTVTDKFKHFVFLVFVKFLMTVLGSFLDKIFHLIIFHDNWTFLFRQDDYMVLIFYTSVKMG